MQRYDKRLDKITDKIIGLAIKVHRELKSGFIEKIYEKALAYEFKKNKINFNEQKVIKVKYESLLLGEQRVDFLVEDEVIVELKAVSEINNIHIAQMLSYLKAADKKIGLILNFSKPTLEIKRVIN